MGPVMHDVRAVVQGTPLLESLHGASSLGKDVGPPRHCGRITLFLYLSAYTRSNVIKENQDPARTAKSFPRFRQSSRINSTICLLLTINTIVRV